MKNKIIMYVFSMILFVSLVHALVINEIMYDPAGADSGHEWVEIHNEQQSSVDVTGYQFFESGGAHPLTLVQGTSTLPAGSYAVIADDSALFLLDHSAFSGTLFDSAWTALSNTGEPLELRDASGVSVDYVYYNSTWGGVANYSIELIDPLLDNNVSSSWLETLDNGGTPGLLNSVSSQAPEFSIMTALLAFTSCMVIFFAVRKRY